MLLNFDEFLTITEQPHILHTKQSKIAICIEY